MKYQFLTVFVFGAISLQAQDDWQSLPQPIGDLITLWSANPASGLPFLPSLPPPDSFTFPPSSADSEVNYICAQWDPSVIVQTSPFETTVSTTQITSTATNHFVRFYTTGSSTTGGPWISFSSEVRGLTPEQVRNVLALPLVPDSIVSVDIPASPDPVTGKQYGLWTGVAGPIALFGDSLGGAVQSRIMSDVLLPIPTHYFTFYEYDGIRYNAQPIGAYTLSYAPLGGGGNAGAIAAYLDQFVPTPHTDLDLVYTSLDFLNWVGFAVDNVSPPLHQALNQMSPECYSALSYVTFRNSVLFSNSILERYAPLRQCRESCCLPSECCNRLWVQGVVDAGNQAQNGDHPGFNYTTYGTIVNYDFQPLCNVTAGVAGSWLGNYVRFGRGFGGAHFNCAKLGLYASYIPSCFFIDGLISGGYNWAKADRLIDFPIATTSATVTSTRAMMEISNSPVYRRASSRQNGYDVEAHVQTGYTFHTDCWWATPLARVSYFYERVEAFREQGADSLNLYVRPIDLQDLRVSLGLGAAYIFEWSCITVIPQMQAMWVHDFVWNQRSIEASVEEVGGSFLVHCFRQDTDSFLGSAALKVLLSGNIAAFIFYDIEVSEHFISNAGRLDLRYAF